jgi:capsular polysaccharide transport system ATP-binding protein
MIAIEHVFKRYPTRSGPVTVLNDVNLTVAPGERVGVLGRNGAGKSTLIRLISGAEQPTTGLVRREMSVSWPLAFGGAFQGALTGLDNLRFICRIYGRKAEEHIDFVQDFSELGLYLREPVRTYSSGMRARLAFAISMVVEFDCFLIDEIVAVGDSRFHDKCVVELFEKRADRAMIIVSHDAGYVREHCHRASVLAGGRLTSFGDVDTAYDAYLNTGH